MVKREMRGEDALLLYGLRAANILFGILFDFENCKDYTQGAVASLNAPVLNV